MSKETKIEKEVDKMSNEWIDYAAGDAVSAMERILDYATDIVELRENWRTKWNRSGDDGTFDYIPACFDVIRWIADAVYFVHMWECASELMDEKEEFERFRTNHPLPWLFMDGVSGTMCDKVLNLAIKLGYSDYELINDAGWFRLEEGEDSKEELMRRLEEEA